MLFQRSTTFLIKSLFVLSFLDVQDNKSRSVVTVLSEIIQLLFFLNFLLDSTLIVSLCKILYNVASVALAQRSFRL